MLTMLDVAIGLAFTYLLLSLLCTAINELIATWTRMRARVLAKAIGRLVSPDGLESPEAAKQILTQPEVLAMSPAIDRPPSYIPKEVFVRAAQRAKIAAVRSDDEWGQLFDATMDRATGWYKRRIQVVSLIVAVGLCVLANADTMRIADRLWRSPILRQQFLEAARQRVADEDTRRFVASYPNPDQPVPPEAEEGEESAEHTAPDVPAPTEQEQELLSGVTGWRSEFPALNAGVCARLEKERDRACGDTGTDADCERVLATIAADPRCRVVGSSLEPTDAWPGAALWPGVIGLILLRLPGWLLTVAAISVGAPFWFDTLQRFVNIRGTGKPPEQKKPA
jgi:hypothetical protein